MQYVKTYILIILTYFTIHYDANAKTLNKALASAVKNNAEIKLEKSRFEQIKATKGDAIADFLPDINATYQRGRQKNDAVGLDRGELDKTNDQDVKRLNLTQPVFSGFSGYNNMKEVDSNIISAKEYYKSKKLEILLRATESYLELFKARALLNIKKKDERSYERLLKLITQRNKYGRVGGSEVIKYQTFVSTAMSDTLSAKTDLFQAQEEYHKIFGMIDENVSLPKIDGTSSLKSENELVKSAVLKNPGLRTYLFKIKAAKYAKNKSKGKFSPIVEISASASEQENVTYLNNRDLKSESIFLNVKVPLFQKGVEYSGLAQANENLRFAKREYQTNKEELIKNVRQSYKEVLFYKDLLKSQEKLVTLTKRRIKNIKQQVKVGDGDMIDLLESELELSKIITQQLNSKADYVLSYYKLMILTGTFSL